MTDCAFIGVDLAWRSSQNPSGAAVLLGDCTGSELAVVAPPLRTIDQVRHFVDQHMRAITVVAIDAPLIIRNFSGQRPCETLVGKRYGKRDASCHTSNLRLYPDAPSVALADALVRDGFVHIGGSAATDARVMIEVYPHAALVALFDLKKIIKYKKGTSAQKCIGLAVLQQHVRMLSHREPSLRPSQQLEDLLSVDVLSLRGKARKSYEDSLDAVVCAYIGFHHWCLEGTRSEIFGDVETGYILNPVLTASSVAAAF
jgi:predicted RNase H-like nuclease